MADEQSACTYVLLAGLPGTGKSTLAQALADGLNALGHSSVILNKDAVRAALFPGDATDYSEAQNALCIDAMLAAAEYLRFMANPPRFLFFDGQTFSHAAQIEHVVSAAEKPGARSDWRILHLVCTDEAAERRLTSAQHHPAADRSFALYRRLKKTFEPIFRPHLLLDSTLPLEASVAAAVSYLVESPRPPEKGRLRILPAKEFIMDKFAIWAQMEAKPGKEAEVEEFLKSAQPLAEAEAGTTTWYALKIGTSRYGIFDTFADEDARKAHLNGEIAKALFAKAKDLFVKEPEVDTPTILAAKAPGA